LVLLIISVSTAFDLREDFEGGVSIAHLVWEGGLTLLGGCCASWFCFRFLKERRERLRMQRERDCARADAARLRVEEAQWKARSSRLIQDLSNAIETQFQRWKLSHAECEIATLLLKGASLKEIASRRQVAEHTVRQQTLAIYQKSGLSGRAALSAFFLGDLLDKKAQGSLGEP
jgi:DNA-binding CsgD family transcriptional regulator